MINFQEQKIFYKQINAKLNPCQMSHPVFKNLLQKSNIQSKKAKVSETVMTGKKMKIKRRVGSEGLKMHFKSTGKIPAASLKEIDRKQ